MSIAHEHVLQKNPTRNFQRDSAYQGHGPLARPFRPFYRAVPNDAHGVGLGLAIAQRAVRLHRGEIRARNAQPGLEVAFSLRSPV